ncbi:TIGR02281 family clan AA aspartic protease [Chitinibacter sp. GC72]|uniref:retropepsin-like aspartic protease family protein n=1 Tax=Chitinibacter sp. GC72 TaxID=1526917 RepID=UPI0012FBDABC|nr:retropepsin-like aspartic protease [Chitinibacter sp. GC72]
MRSTTSIVLVWLLVCGLIYWAFDALILKQHNPNSLRITANQGQTLVLKRSRDGHFRLSATMNQEPVVLLIDTGASMVTVGEALANRLKLPRGEAFITQTANGETSAYWSQVTQMSLGPYMLENVRVGVVPRLGDEALLGMNVLKNFSVQIAGDQMTIKSLE